MSDRADAYDALSDAVEALERLGLDVEDAQVKQVMKGGQPSLFGQQGGREVDAIQLLATVPDERPDQEAPDPDDPDNGEGVEIGFESDSESESASAEDATEVPTDD